MDDATAVDSANPPAAAEDRRCQHCGYSLHGLKPENRCPECGFDVAYSVSIMRHVDPVWLGKVGQGLALLMVGCLTVAGSIAGSSFLELPGSLATVFWWMRDWLHLLGFFGVMLACVGIWSITAYDRGLMEHRDGGGPRRAMRIILRILVIIAPVALIARPAFGALWRWNAREIAGVLIADVPPALIIANLFTYLVWIASFAEAKTLSRRLRWAAPMLAFYIVGTALVPWDWLLDWFFPARYQSGLYLGGSDVLLMCDVPLAFAVFYLTLATYRALLRARWNADPHCRRCFCSLHSGLDDQACPVCARPFVLSEPGSVLRTPSFRDTFRSLLHDLLLRAAIPPRRVSRLVPWFMLILSAWASCLPRSDADHAPTFIWAARWIWYFCVGSFALVIITGAIVHRRRGHVPLSRQLAPTLFDHRRRLMIGVLLLLAAMCVQLSSLPERLLFSLHQTELDSYAQRVAAMPFSDHPGVPPRIGPYWFVSCDRCPHGLAFRIVGAGGFFYRTDPGDCSLHVIGSQISGNWYDMEW